MRFSIRFFFIVIALFGLILASLISKNEVFIELTTGIIFMSFAVALALAIWDSNYSRRPFWTGYVAVGVTSIIFTSFSGYSNTADQIAALFGRPQSSGTIIGYDSTGYPIRSATIELYRPAGSPPPATTSQSQFAAITNSIPFFLSFIAGIIGGSIAMIASGPRQPED